MILGSINMRYRVLRVIGASRMSTVYKVWDSASSRVLALKASADFHEKHSEELLAKEYMILSHCSHPGIVQAVSLDRASEGAALQPGTLFFTMEYIPGRTLNRVQLMSMMKLEEILLQILAALKTLHNTGIVCGDIKPHNIMVFDDDRGKVHVKLFDFGLAVREGKSSNGHEISGTLLYIAPEVLRGGTIDRRTDLYSLGAMLYELMTGVPPFKGTDAISVAYKHIVDVPVNPSSLNPALPEKYERLITKLLQKDPDKRFQSVEAVLSFLKKREVMQRSSDRFRVLESAEKIKRMPEEVVSKEQ